jgi:hypothetical protein
VISRDMTTGEADAFRAGWQLGRAAAADAAIAGIAINCGCLSREPTCVVCATVHRLVRAIRAMEPPK